MKHLPLFLLCAAAGAQAQSSDVKPLPVHPNHDLSQQSGPWIAPVKDGVHATSNAHLSAAERAAHDAAVSRRGPAGAHAGEDGKPLPAGMLEGLDFETPADFLQLDEPGDGALWAHGGTYKARFDSDGASYIPYFGPGTPRNFPVDFRLASATLGGEPLTLDLDGEPAFHGESVHFERGACVELYDLRPGEIEQLFVFDTLPGSGALALEIDAVTDLTPADQGTHLAFTGEHGDVRYGLAVAIDAAGRRADVETKLVDGGIRLVVPADFIASATLPLVVDPVISTFDINIDSNRHDILPDVAYDAVNFRWHITYSREFSLVDYDVWSELRNSSGDLVAGSGLYLDITTNDWRSPKTANNRVGTNFMMVGQVRPSAGGEIKIWSRIREAESNGTGAQIQVSYGAGNMYNPDVGGDPVAVGPTYYCVVWERAVSFGNDHDIQGGLMTSAGLVLLGGGIDIDSTSGSYDKFPRISNSNGIAPFPSQRWNIVWQREFSSADWDIRGAQVRWDGAVMEPSFSIDFATSDDRFPAASSPLLPPPAGDRTWMAVYRRLGTDSVYDIRAKCWRGADQLTAANLSSLQGTNEDRHQYEPSVDTNGHQFVVAWTQQYASSTTDTDIYVTSWYLSEEWLYPSEAHVNLAFSSTPELQVEVYARHSSGLSSDWVLAAWRDGAAGNGNIEGALYDTPDFYGPHIGSRYCSPAVANSTGSPAYIEASGSGYAGGEPFSLRAMNMPTSEFGYFIASPNQTSFSPGTSVGVVCVGNPLSRFNSSVQSTGGSGEFHLHINTNSIPVPAGGTVAIAQFETWNFQGWYRDGGVNNLTDAVSVYFR